MKHLHEIQNKTVIVLERCGNEEEKKYLNNIGIDSESLISVVKNEINTNQPLLIEVNNARFMLSRDLAKKILVDNVLAKQKILFKGNKTQQREIILGVIQNFTHHFSLKECIKKVEEVVEKNNMNSPNASENIGDITVYRTVKALKEKHILDEIVLPNGEIKYEIHKEHHDHIFCKNCGNIIEFYSEEIENLQKEIAEKHGVKLYSHSLTMIGLECEKCK